MDCYSLAIGVRHEPGYALITAAGDIGVFIVARLCDHLFTLAGDGRPMIVGSTAPCGSPAPEPERSWPWPPPPARPPKPQPVHAPPGGDDYEDG